MLYNTGFQHVPKTKTCSQHQFSTMSSNTPTASRWGLVAYKPWSNVRWLHNTATRRRLDSQRRRCWPWVVRHMPQTRRYLGYGRTFLKHGGVVSECWTQYGMVHRVEHGFGFQHSLKLLRHLPKACVHLFPAMSPFLPCVGNFNSQTLADASLCHRRPWPRCHPKPDSMQVVSLGCKLHSRHTDVFGILPEGGNTFHGVLE
jgi:hypothetical protein